MYRIRIEQENILQKEGVGDPAFAQGKDLVKKKKMANQEQQSSAGVYTCFPVSPFARQHFSLVLTLLFILS